MVVTHKDTTCIIIYDKCFTIMFFIKSYNKLQKPFFKKNIYKNLGAYFAKGREGGEEYFMFFF